MNKSPDKYHKTRVGLIPEKWACSTFGNEFDIQLGKMLSAKAAQQGSKYRYLANINVRWGYFELSNLRVMRFTDAEVTKYSLLHDDLLVCEGGEFGRCAVWEGELSECLFQKAIHRLRAKSDKVSPWYAMYYMHRAARSSLLMGYIGESSIAHFTKEKFASFPLPLPPLPEQTAIAEVLACWDKAIRLYERKLELKREVKKGLMRKLLAGEWRLPGFSGKWASARFGEVFGFVKTYAYSREQLTIRGAGNSILNIHYGDLHSSYTDILLDVGNEKQIPEIKIGVDVPDDLNCLRDGDLVIADASEDYKGVGACVEIKNVGDRKLIGGLHTMVARDSDGRTVPGYRGYILKETVVAKTMQQMATGVSVHGLSKSNLSKIAIRLPSPDEQHAIASVLADADKDISCLSSKLTLLRDQKKYLLSKLVTGAIRLPQFREAS